MADTAARRLAEGCVCLGIELGSTQVKACLVDADHPGTVLARGIHTWENELRDGLWSYPLDAVWSALRGAYAALADACLRDHGRRPARVRAIGVSAMMHGYLAVDDTGTLLVPFRTWRNTSTTAAAAELRTLFGRPVPLRWSIAHLHQAVLDGEEHVSRIAALNTLAGHVHERLTGRRVLGVGDAAGMFPLDAQGRYDTALIDAYDRRAASSPLRAGLRDLLPEILPAGAAAGTLTDAGAALLDATGTLQPGALFCPPEGDAGTGMVATGALEAATANVSVGTSVFACVVADTLPAGLGDDIDIVATPEGRPVAMVHSNNGASELGAWAGVFADFARRSGVARGTDAVFRVLLEAAEDAAADAGGILAYNQLSGEPLLHVDDGGPAVVRTPESTLSLPTLMRAQLYGVFAALAVGMRELHAAGVRVDRVYAHGGLFKTAGVAQRALAAALDAPVAVARTASEGGAWGMAVLAAYRAARDGSVPAPADSSAVPGSDGPAARGLAAYVHDVAVDDDAVTAVRPDPVLVAGFDRYLERYRAGLTARRAAPARKENTDDRDL